MTPTVNTVNVDIFASIYICFENWGGGEATSRRYQSMFHLNYWVLCVTIKVIFAS